MKTYYAKAGVPTARCHKITTAEAAKQFLQTVGYPVIVKPDNGVGASDTFKLESDADFDRFFADLPTIPCFQHACELSDFRPVQIQLSGSGIGHI